MKKQKFLAELSQFLTFMTEEDRANTIARYSAMFDAAGPEGEEELLARLGSPTKTAVTLSRGYEPGSVEVPEVPDSSVSDELLNSIPEVSWDDVPDISLPVFTENPPAETVAPAAAAEEPAPEGEVPQDDVFADIPLPLEDVWEPGAVGEEPAADEEASADDGEEEAELPTAAGRDPLFPEEPLDYGEYEEPAKRRSSRASAPFGLVLLFILGVIAIGLPLAAVILVLIFALLVPGCSVAVCAWLAAVGGLWCLTYLADALLLFGAGFLVLAVALLLLALGIWCDTQLVTLYVRLIRFWAGLTMGGEED